MYCWKTNKNQRFENLKALIKDLKEQSLTPFKTGSQTGYSIEIRKVKLINLITCFYN